MNAHHTDYSHDRISMASTTPRHSSLASPDRIAQHMRYQGGTSTVSSRVHATEKEMNYPASCSHGDCWYSQSYQSVPSCRPSSNAPMPDPYSTMPPHLIPNPSLWQSSSPPSPSQPVRALTRDTSTISSVSSPLLPSRPGTQDLTQPPPSAYYRVFHHPSRLSRAGSLHSDRHSQGWEDIELQEIRRQQDTRAQRRQGGSRRRRRCCNWRRKNRFMAVVTSWQFLLGAAIVAFFLAAALYTSGAVRDDTWFV